MKQAKTFFDRAEGYKLEHLKKDLAKSPDNLQIPFSQILDVISEEKDWGTLLKVKMNLGNKSKVLPVLDSEGMDKISCKRSA